MSVICTHFLIFWKWYAKHLFSTFLSICKIQFFAFQWARISKEKHNGANFLYCTNETLQNYVKTSVYRFSFFLNYTNFPFTELAVVKKSIKAESFWITLCNTSDYTLKVSESLKITWNKLNMWNNEEAARQISDEEHQNKGRSHVNAILNLIFTFYSLNNLMWSELKVNISNKTDKNVKLLTFSK